MQIVDPIPQWYSVALPKLIPSATRPSAGLLSTLQTQAVTLLARENSLYAASLAPRAPASAPPAPNGLSKADQVFIQQILTSGTSSDKLSALLLLVSSSPLHTMAYLDQIVAICKKKSREESGRAIRGVVEWWRGGGGDGGGSPSRKLRAFADQPGLESLSKSWSALEAFGKGREKKVSESELSKEECERCLVIWAFEDWLKKWFFEVLKCVEVSPLISLPRDRSLTRCIGSKCRSILLRILELSPSCICRIFCETNPSKKEISSDFSSTNSFVCRNAIVRFVLTR